MAPFVALVLITAIGLGRWLPGPGWGVRSLAGWALLPLMLDMPVRLFGLPLHMVAWGVFGLALVGWGRAGVAAWRARRIDFRAVAAHPLPVLGAAVVALAAAVGPGGYVPLHWDELSNWLAVPRQMFTADAVWRADMVFSNPGYTPGWYLQILYPNLMFESRFSELPGLAALAAGWVCFGALLWDVLGRFAAGTAARWAFLSLVLLAAPTAWLGPDLLIEPPQRMLTAAPLILLLAVPRDAAEARRLALATGLLLAGSYFLKVAGIVLLAALPLFVWRFARPGGIAALVGLLLPVAAVHVYWTLAGPPGVAGQCMTSPLAMLLADGAGALSRIAPDYAARSLDVLAGWLATPAGGLGILGMLGAAWIGALRPLPPAVLAYLAVYGAALLWSYGGCVGGFEQATLGSLERFQGLALDAAALAGLAALAAVLARALPVRAERGGILRLAAAGLGLALAAQMVWRGVERAPSLADPFAPGHPYPAAYVEKRLPILMGLDDLRRVVVATRTADGAPPTVAVIAQETDGLERFLLRYHGLGRDRGGPLRDFAVLPRHSWTATGGTWSVAAAPEEIRADLRRADILWPRRVDRYIGPVLADFVDSAACSSFVRAFLLWRSDPGTAYRCVFNEGVVRYYETRAAGT